MTNQKLIHVAVIGDVQIDHAFISNEPPKGRLEASHPWTYYPGLHLFSIPGGAWFTGHMVQAALEGASFSRTYAARIKNGTHVKLKGKIRHKTESGNEHRFVIKCDDEITCRFDDRAGSEQQAKGLLVLEATRGKKYASQPLEIVIEAMIERTDFNFNAETSNNPGRIEVDQLRRYFTAENYRAVGLKCFSLTLTAINAEWCITEYINTDQGRYKRNGTPLKITGSTMTFSSTCSPFELCAASSSAGDEFIFNNSVSIEFSKSDIEIIFGKLGTELRSIDNGKLNKPDSSELNQEPSNKPAISISQHDVPQFHSIRKGRIWIYTHPGKSIQSADSSDAVQTLCELQLFPVNANLPAIPHRVYRRARSHGVQGPEVARPKILETSWSKMATTRSHRSIINKFKSGDTICKVVVIDDEGLGFSDNPLFWAPFIHDFEKKECDILKQTLTNDSNWELDPELIAKLNEFCSNTLIVVKVSHWINATSSPLLRLIAQTELRNNCIIIASGDALRQGFIGRNRQPGIKLAKKVSWEKTIEDFIRAIESGELGLLENCRHLVVRLGLEAAIHCERDVSIGPPPALEQGVSGRDQRWKPLELTFDEKHIEDEYCRHDKFGDLPGLTTVFVAAIVKHIYESLLKDPNCSNIRLDKPAVAIALQSCRRYFDFGFGPEPRTIKLIESLQIPIVQIFGNAPVSGCVDNGRHRFAYHKINLPIIKDQPDTWSILGSHLRQRPPSKSDRDADEFAQPIGKRVYFARNALSLGRRIVKRGVDRAVIEARPDFPYARFGDLLVVDRREIEGLRSLKNLFAEYIHRADRKKPLSVGVFGPPGSGKSFCVTELAKEVVGHRLKLEQYTFNLAQITSFSQLTEQLLEVRDASLRESLPLVFFDEFDAELNTVPLGWLKYFLAPMQDGCFYHNNSVLGIGKAVFVFAGGVAPSHAMFRSSKFWADKYGDDQSRSDLFSSAKGSDFHSRLRGFLDIVGINPDVLEYKKSDDANAANANDYTSDEDFLFVVRRAIVLRKIIERVAVHEKSLLDVDDNAYFDSDVLNAFLLCSRYLHGARSIESIVDMSTLHGQREYTKTALPSQQQYSMHVDKTFRHILLGEYSLLPSVLRELFDYIH